MEKPPVIGLRAAYQIIDDSGDKPVWKTIGHGVDSSVAARAVAGPLGHKNVWIKTPFGRRMV